LVGLGSATQIGIGVGESKMNATLFRTDLATHLKIVAIGLMGATLFTWAAILAHWNINGM
jgi:hypothetical protein